MRETETHIYFWGGEYSQWAKSIFTIDGQTFVTAEQYMMYSKAILFGDKKKAELILKTSDAKRQKLLGRQVRNFNFNLWNEKKFDIVVTANVAKFEQNKSMKGKLLSNNKIIVEASPYDKVWGIGLKFDDDRVLADKLWKGENLLGKALMKTRDLLQGNK
jgi:ribA/ribD-fused uncharacterized protein